MQPKPFKVTSLMLLILFLFGGVVFGQTKTLVYKFKAADDGFFVSYGKNRLLLEELFLYIDQYKDEILSGKIPIELTGYCDASKGGDRLEDLRMASVRANRIKSEMINIKGLREECFITRALSYPYRNQSDVVVVILTIPSKDPQEVSPKNEIKEQEKEVNKEKEVKVKPEEPSVPTKEYMEENRDIGLGDNSVSISSNLLYTLALVPNLGLEWKPNPGLGIMLSGAFSKWNFDGGNKHHRVWMVSPELRLYMGEHKRMYFGGMFLIGEFNMKFSDTGYQGNYLGGGLIVGYLLPLSTHFSLDFGLGLGGMRADYQSYIYENAVNVLQSDNLTRDYWGPTKVGITLMWKPGK